MEQECPRCVQFSREFSQLKQEFAQLSQKCAQQEEEIRDLKEKLGTNSRNSSKPSSQDPYRRSRSSRPTGRKPGGQFGHPGHKREPYLEEEVTENIDLRPEECPRCCGKLFEESSLSVTSHQVVDLPEVSPKVTQYRAHTLKCARCGKKVRAQLPEGAKHGFGPRLQAFLVTQVSDSHLSKRKIRGLVSYFRIGISLGSICNIHKRATTLLKPSAEKIQKHVLRKGRIHADETSWKVKGKGHYLWVGTTPDSTFFKIDSSRSAEAYNRIFGPFNGTLTSDRYGVYNQHTGRRQSCLAHIDRSLEKMGQREGIDGFCGRASQRELGKTFSLWHEYRNEKFSREELQEKAKDPIENFRAILTFAKEKATVRQSRSLAHNLLKCFESLWTFLYEDGVEPTNNLAERVLRPCVILRKNSQGNRSNWGINFIERLMTVAVTLKQRSENLFQFLTELFASHYRARSPPSLIL